MMGTATRESEFVHLSFEEYALEAKRDFDEIRRLNKVLIKNDRSFENDIRMIKDAYANRSMEDNGEEQKVAFGVRIKEFFLKLWKTICLIFERIAALVVNLIKSVIIYLKKKKLQSNLIFKKVESAGGVKAYNFRNDDIIGKAFKKNATIKTIVPKSNKGDKPTSMVGTHDYIIGTLNSKLLKSFMDIKVNTDNTKSMYDFEILKQELVDKNRQTTQDKNEKLRNLEESIDDWYARAIFFNEPNPTNRMNNVFVKLFNTSTNSGLINSMELAKRNIVPIAHRIATGSPYYGVGNMPISNYFGLSGTDMSKDIHKLAIYFEEYYNISQLVVGNGGYIERLESTLKAYNASAKRDAKAVKQLRDSVMAYIDGQMTYGEATDKSSAKTFDYFNRISNIVQKIKLMKAHFIQLRQVILMDIIQFYNVENTAWSILTGAFKKVSDDMAIPDTDNDFIMDDDTIVKRPGFVKTHYYDDDEV